MQSVQAYTHFYFLYNFCICHVYFYIIFRLKGQNSKGQWFQWLKKEFSLWRSASFHNYGYKPCLCEAACVRFVSQRQVRAFLCGLYTTLGTQRSVLCTFHNTLSRFAEVRRNCDDRREKPGQAKGKEQGRVKRNGRAAEPCPSDLATNGSSRNVESEFDTVDFSNDHGQSPHLAFRCFFKRGRWRCLLRVATMRYIGYSEAAAFREQKSNNVRKSMLRIIVKRWKICRTL